MVLRRLFSRAYGGLTAVGRRFRVLAEPGRFLGEGSECRKGVAVQEGGASREDETDKGEEKGETDGLGVALRGVDVHPRWIEKGGGEVFSSPFSDIRPSSSESSMIARSFSRKGRRGGVRAKV